MFYLFTYIHIYLFVFTYIDIFMFTYSMFPVSKSGSSRLPSYPRFLSIPCFQGYDPGFWELHCTEMPAGWDQTRVVFGGFFEGGASNSTILTQDRPKHKPRYMLIGFLFCYFQGCFRQLLVNCWFGARWFGYLGSPYERDCYLGVPLESQIINPNQQLTIS